MLPGKRLPRPRAGRGPLDPGGRRDPDRSLPERVKRMVGKVLTGNGITRCGRGSYALVGGEAVFAHRSRHRTPISGSIKVRVHRCARGRCECCGAGCCSANPAPTGPGGGPHRAQEPRRFRRPQQPAGPLLPLQCRQARCCLPTQEGTTDFRGLQVSYARRVAGCVSARWRAAAGCCWRTS